MPLASKAPQNTLPSTASTPSIQPTRPHLCACPPEPYKFSFLGSSLPSAPSKGSTVQAALLWSFCALSRRVRYLFGRCFCSLSRLARCLFRSSFAHYPDWSGTSSAGAFARYPHWSNASFPVLLLIIPTLQIPLSQFFCSLSQLFRCLFRSSFAHYPSTQPLPHPVKLRKLRLSLSPSSKSPSY